jgi:hypothetical protein
VSQEQNDETRNDAESDLWLSELGVVGGDDDIAHHGELTAPTQSIARHSSDGLMRVRTA